MHLQPSNFEADSNLGSILRRRGDLDGAEAAFRKACRSIRITNVPIAIFALDFNASVSRCNEEKRRWAERFADPLSVGVPNFAIDRDPDRKLRIGYVSEIFEIIRQPSHLAILERREAFGLLLHDLRAPRYCDGKLRNRRGPMAPCWAYDSSDRYLVDLSSLLQSTGTGTRAMDCGTTIPDALRVRADGRCIRHRRCL